MGKNIVKLAFMVGISLVAGFIGSIFTTMSIKTWYPTLVKPAFSPPDWLFGPVWTTLFVLMGIAAFLIWKQNEDFIKERPVKTALSIFFLQLILNISWSAVFFGLQSIVGGLIVLVILWFAILATMLQFFSLCKTAGWLLLPYLLWVTFAGVLNATFYYLN